MSFSLNYSVSTLCKATGIIGILAGCPMLPRYLEVKETPKTATYCFAVAQGMMEGRFLNGTLTKEKNLQLRHTQAQALVAITDLSGDIDDEDKLHDAGQKIAELLWQIEH